MTRLTCFSVFLQLAVLLQMIARNCFRGSPPIFSRVDSIVSCVLCEVQTLVLEVVFVFGHQEPLSSLLVILVLVFTVLPLMVGGNSQRRRPSVGISSVVDIIPEHKL